MIIYIILIIALVSTVLGGLFAIKFKDKLHMISGFGAGAILGVALFDMLPESIDLTNGNYSLLTMTVVMAFGFSLYMLIDRIFSLHAHNDNDCENKSHNSKFGALAIIFHSLIDGFGIGVAFKVSPAAGLAVAIAVLVHGFADGINTVNMIMKNKARHQSAIRWLLVDSIAPAVGVLLAYMVTIPGPILGLVLALFFGLFLYISTSDLIPESHHDHPTMGTTISTIFGMLIIFLVISLTS